MHEGYSDDDVRGSRGQEPNESRGVKFWFPSKATNTDYLN